MPPFLYSSPGLPSAHPVPSNCRHPVFKAGVAALPTGRLRRPAGMIPPPCALSWPASLTTRGKVGTVKEALSAQPAIVDGVSSMVRGKSRPIAMKISRRERKKAMSDLRPRQRCSVYRCQHETRRRTPSESTTRLSTDDADGLQTGEDFMGGARRPLHRLRGQGRPPVLRPRALLPPLRLGSVPVASTIGDRELRHAVPGSNALEAPHLTRKEGRLRKGIAGPRPSAGRGQRTPVRIPP